MKNRRRGSNYVGPSIYLADRDVQRRYLKLYMGGSPSSYTHPEENESKRSALSPTAQFKTVNKDFNVLLAYLDGGTPYLVLINRTAEWEQRTSDFIALHSDGRFIRFAHGNSNNQRIERFETIPVSKLTGFFRAIDQCGARTIRERRKTARGIEIKWRIVSAKKRRIRPMPVPKKTA